jgi:hypothetical protein
MDEYIRSTAGVPSADEPGGQADQLRKLADLKADGTLSDEEFQRAKAKLLA